MGYVVRDVVRSSAHNHPGHRELNRMLTESVDGLDGQTWVHSRLLSVRATAERLGVSAATVYSLVASRQHRCLRISNAIRIHPDDLTAYLSQH
jgi:excisionase family DNA binding protein